MVFQDFRLLPYLDVRQNILAPALAIRDIDSSRADTLMGELGLVSRKSHRPKQLSAGKQQRTALARALLSGPKVLLTDEPTGNLDAENTDQVLSQLHRFAEQGGTVLTATHDPSIAAAADLRLRIDQGKLVS